MNLRGVGGITFAPDLPASAVRAISAGLMQAPREGRLVRMKVAGAGTLWLKRVEKLSGRLRWQKGDPRRGFEAEREGLRILGALDLPVARLAAEGPDFLLLRDSGTDLARLATGGTLSGTALRRAFAASGRALARLHAAGFAHGRPVLRDICWDGRAARFIDLERFRAGPAPSWRRSADVVMLVQSWFTLFPEGGPQSAMSAALAAYIGTAGPQARVSVAGLSRRLAPVGTLARALLHLRPRSRELRAVPLTLGSLAALDRPRVSRPRPAGPAGPAVH
ncbi:MAG TPA: hypothetical protein PKD10_13585 [Paracoccaceae bacterium]|nr:hypothetical protein [Paracoccaceae bacterium]